MSDRKIVPNMGKMRTGPAGAGRPTNHFPEQYRPAALEMWRDKKGIDDIRQMLLSAGHNVSKKAIADVVTPPETLSDVAKAMEKRLDETRNLSSESFTDEMRVIVDDFILDNREPSRICAWLKMEGMSVTLPDVVEYVIARKEELTRAPVDPVAVEIQRLGQHTKILRQKLLDVWENLPLEKRYSEKVLIGLLSELRFSQAAYIAEMRSRKDAGSENLDEANAEIERKLGLAPAGNYEGDPAPIDQRVDPVDEHTPSGAEAAMGATV